MTMTAGAMWLNETFAAFDEGITLAVHKLYESSGSWMTPIMEFISLLGNYSEPAPPALSAFPPFRYSDDHRSCIGSHCCQPLAEGCDCASQTLCGP